MTLCNSFDDCEIIGNNVGNHVILTHVFLPLRLVHSAGNMTEPQPRNFSPTDVNKVKSSVKNSCEYLADVRKTKKHEPLVVASVGQMLIEKYYSKLREDDSMCIISLHSVTDV
jgi:hypothetical protein